VADFKSEGAAGLELEIRRRKTFFWVGLQGIGCSRPRTRSPPPKIDFSGQTSSYRLCRAWDSKSTAENRFVVADFKSEAAAGPELEIRPRKSFFGVRLQVIGYSGPGTRNPPPKNNFWWWTSSPRVQLAQNSKSTAENLFFGSDYELSAAAGPELEVRHRKSKFRVGLRVIGCVGPGTRNPPPKIDFWWRTSSPMWQRARNSKSATKNHFSGRTTSYRLQLAPNSKSATENLFFGSDFKLLAVSGLGLEIHPRKSIFGGGLQVRGRSWPRT